VSSDEVLEREGPERAAVVGHDRYHRCDLAGRFVHLGQVGQRVPEQRLVVGQRQLDRGDRVVLVAGR
jgi:hypothetical protein